MKSNSAVAQIGIITFGKEAQAKILSLSESDQNKYYRKCAKAIADRLNTQLTGLVIHRDESAPHAHFQMLAINQDGLPVSKEKYGIKSEIQDVAGSVYKPLGVHRGKRKSERMRDGESESAYINRSVKELHQDLPNEIRLIEEKISAAETKLKKNEGLIKKNLASGKAEIEKVKKRIGNYQDRAESAKTELAEAKSELTKLNKLKRKIKSPPVKSVEVKTGWRKTKTIEYFSRKQTIAFVNQEIAEAQAGHHIDLDRLSEKNRELEKRIRDLSELSPESVKFLKASKQCLVEEMENGSWSISSKVKGNIGFAHFKNGSIAMFASSSDARDALRNIDIFRDRVKTLSSKENSTGKAPAGSSVNRIKPTP